MKLSTAALMVGLSWSGALAEWAVTLIEQEKSDLYQQIMSDTPRLVTDTIDAYNSDATKIGHEVITDAQAAELRERHCVNVLEVFRMYNIRPLESDKEIVDHCIEFKTDEES